MDKYEFKLKVDEMKALVSARNYNAAAEIAETINWRKIRNLNALVLAGEVFEQVGRYEDSKEILLMAYDKSPIGRNIIYRLAEISIKTKRFEEAQEYYDEFVDIAPHDNLKFVLKYKMTAAQGLPYKEQIKILEELKEQEYSEEWAYELAYLYHKDMQPEKCVEACDELILWFGDGIYVEKALELKMHYQPLTKPQEEKYRIFRQKRTGVIEVKPNDFLESGEIVHEAVEIPSVQTNTSQYNTANLQKEIAKGMRQINAVRMQRTRTDTRQDTKAYIQPEPLQPQTWQEPQMPQEAHMQQSRQEQIPQQPPPQQTWQGQPRQASEPYLQQQIQQDSFIKPESPQDSYLEPQPFSPMTMEEIQAEWERTKQAMNEALYKTEGREQESSKEQSLDKAEQLMQRLLGIVPQLAGDMQEQSGQITSAEGLHPAEVQNDLEQAGRIVAGINQLLQAQIDSLKAAETSKPAPPVPRVSDPTREMPQLPENMLEGKEIGAIEKETMNGNSLKKNLSKEDDNPVMSAWKEAVPGISAIDLLQRVRMEKTAADSSAQMQTENTAAVPEQQVQTQNMAADPVQQIQTQAAPANPVRQVQTQNTATDPVPQTMHPVMETAQQTQMEHLDMEPVQQMQTEYPDMEPVQQMQTEYPDMEPVQQMQGTDGLLSKTPHAKENYINLQPEKNQIELRRPAEYSGRKEAYFTGDANHQAEDFTHNAEPLQPDDFSQHVNPMQAEDFTHNAEPLQPDDFSQHASPVQPEDLSMKMDDSAEHTRMKMDDSAEHMRVESGYPPQYRDNGSNYPQPDLTWNTEQEYPSQNNGRIAEPEFENEQENLLLASKPKFLTQAQLQAESFMDEKINTQTRKDVSKEAVPAAGSPAFYERISQPDSQHTEQMKKLTPEQKEIFSYFVPIAGMEAQIYDLLKGVSEHLQYEKHAQSGNIIIEGISGSGKTVLIMDIIKVLQKEIKRPAGRTGKIDANALNQKDLDVLMDKISGGCLIIESAGRISRETAVRLSRCMDNDHAGTLYILEDTPEGIQKALERDSSFTAKFTEKISIPQFSSDELVEFGKAYANDLNYDIDEMGVLALYKRIGAIQKLDHVTTLTEVKEIVDEAIDHAEKGVLKKVFGMLTATRANDDNYIILREKDFEE